jgi:Spy/CpxP family protein refolding chaperone
MQRPAGQPGEMIARELGLSQEQKAKIQEILKAHREEIGTAMKAAGELHKKFQVAVEAGDEAGARAAAAEIGKAMADGAAKRIAVKKEIEAVLTPEQKAKGEELRKAHQAKMEKVREAAKGRIQERLQNRRGGQGGPDGAGKDGGCCPPAAGNGEGMNNPPPMEEEEGMGNPPPAEEESEE